MIRRLETRDFKQLIDMYEEMYIAMYDPTISLITVTSILCSELNQPTFIGYGSFNEQGDMQAAICGFATSNGVFHISALISHNSFVLPKLFKTMEKCLKEQGYSSWTTDYRFNDNRCLAKSMGATIEYTRYRKDI